MDHARMIVAASVLASGVAACTSATGAADERYNFVQQHGTVRELCEEAKRRKTIYTEAGKYDSMVWLQANSSCLAVQIGRGDEPADRSSAAYRQYKQVENDVSNQLAISESEIEADVANSQRAEVDDSSLPICDRADSPSKAALMNSTGTSCSAD